MSLVFLDSTAPAGMVRVYDTETEKSVLVPQTAEAMREAATAARPSQEEPSE